VMRVMGNPGDANQNPNVWLSSCTGPGAWNHGTVVVDTDLTYDLYSTVAGAQNDMSRIQLMDFNADRKADFLKIVPARSGSTPAKIYLSNGDGTWGAANDGPSFAFASSTDTDRIGVDIARIKSGDFNGDGCTDLARVQGWGSTDPLQVYLSNCDG